MQQDTRSDDDLDSLASPTTQGLTRRGLAVMGVGIRRQWRLFAVSVLLSVIYGVTTVGDAWVLGWVTDHAVDVSMADGDVAVGALWIGMGLFFAMAALRTAGVVGRRLVGGIVFFRLVRDDRQRVTRRYVELPLSWHRAHPTGQLLSNANADAEATWGVFMPLPMAIGVVAMLVTAVVTMILIDPVLTAVGLVIFPLLFAMNAVYQKYQGPRLAKAQSLRGEVSAVAHESFDGALVIKSLGRENDETRRFDAISRELADANVRVGKLRAILDPLIDVLPHIGVLLILGFGATRAAAGHVQASDVIEVAYLFSVVAMPVRSLGWVVGELPRSVTGADRIDAVLNADARMDYGSRELTGVGPLRVSVQSLRQYHHDAGDHPVLDEIDLEIPAGSLTAIVGPTGSGKSTLVSLLSRLDDPSHGAIELDGVDAREISWDSLAANVAVVPQSTFLFDDTVGENIALGRAVSTEDIWRVLDIVQARDFVDALPDGLDTMIGERGTSLSGGQRQRLALARALIGRPRLLILDDATSALDPRVERRVFESLADDFDHEMTIIVVAYRRATIALADQVIVIEGGRVVGAGSNEDLTATSEAYRTLVNAYDDDAAAGSVAIDNDGSLT